MTLLGRLTAIVFSLCSWIFIIVFNLRFAKRMDAALRIDLELWCEFSSQPLFKQCEATHLLERALTLYPTMISLCKVNGIVFIHYNPAILEYALSRWISNWQLVNWERSLKHAGLHIIFTSNETRDRHKYWTV